jgi:hypothetical protein
MFLSWSRQGIAGFVGVLVIAIMLSGSGLSEPGAIDGQVVVWFQDEDTTVVEVSDSTITTIYPALNAICDSCGVETVVALFADESLLRNVYLFEFVDTVDVDSLIAVLSELSFIRSAGRNGVGTADVTPDDYAFNHDYWEIGHDVEDGRPDQWTFQRMQVDRAWDITRGASSVIHGVIDTGLDWLHPDLQARIWVNVNEDRNGNGQFDNFPWGEGGDIDNVDSDGNGKIDDVIGWDFIGQSISLPGDEDNDPIHADYGANGCHGTVMSGMICANSNNYIGGAGISWYGKTIALRTGEGSYVYTDAIIGALNYAIDKGADVINMSFQLSVVTSDTAAVHEVISRGYYEKGIVFVAAAGNDNGEYEIFPGSWPEVIRVAAVDSLGYKTTGAKGSNYGYSVGLSAPTAQTHHGFEGIVSTSYFSGDTIPGLPEYPTGHQPHIYGFTELATSGATAEVSGIVSLLKSMYPNATPSFIRSELTRGAMPLPDPLWDEDPEQSKLGAGMVNAYRSLTQWGTISQNTTWSNTVYVSGDITVADDATLTVSPGTTVYMMPDDNERTGYDTTRVEFHVKGGFLDVNGTAEAPVRFVAWDESGGTSDSTAWWCIFLWDTLGSGASFEYCTIKNAMYGIEDQVNITLNHCTIENCGKRGIVVAYADSVFIDNTTIRNIGPADHTNSFGLSVLAGSTVQISESRIEKIGTSAARVLSGSTLWADNTYFLESDVGLYAWRDYADSVKVDVDLCLFRNNDYGIWIKGPAVDDVLVNECVVDSNTTANVYCENAANIDLQRNVIMYSTVGVLAHGSAPSITNHSSITHNLCGIKCDNNAEGVVIEETEIADNGIGVSASEESDPDLGGGSWGSSGNNDIESNTNYHISNLSEEVTIYATNNYWGNDTPPCLPKASKFYGLVEYSDPLCEPPLVSEAVVVVDTPEAPTRYALEHNYPNPFNPTTRIRYAVPPPGGRVLITVYNVQGQRVATLVDAEKSADFYSVTWDGTSTHGVPVASGVYFVRMAAPGFETTKKVLLLK